MPASLRTADRAPSAPAQVAGSVTVTVVPLPGAVSTSRSPPCCSTIFSTKGMPSRAMVRMMGLSVPSILMRVNVHMNT